MRPIRFITVAFLSLIVLVLSNSCLDRPLGEGYNFSHNLFNGESNASAQITVNTPDDKEPNTLLTAPSLSTARSTEFNSKTNSNLLLSQAKEPETNKYKFLADIPPIYLGIIGSLLAGLATGVGGLPILFISEVSERVQGILLGFGAGVMLAATSFSLLLPSIEAASNRGSTVNAANIVVAGTLLGGIFLWFTHRYFPYERYIKKPKGSNSQNLKGIWLFVIAIAIHNFPEGLAVGVGFGEGDLGNGLALAIGIGLQNLPEGLAVALALITENYSKVRAFWISLFTGLLEPVGGVVGAGIISLGQALLPWGMSFAAGAMLFVICDSIIPESQTLGRGKEVTAGLMVGFVIMMYLDVTLG